VERDHEDRARTRPAAVARPHGVDRLLPRVDRQELAAIFAGGFIGATARGALAESVATRPDRWPWATFTVNVVGAFLLGYFATRLNERLAVSLYGRSFLATGICGALTTFSTMMVELLKMVEGSRWGLAAGYTAASVGCGMGAVFVSTKLVRRASLSR
jgi:fluoride exporter